VDIGHGFKDYRLSLQMTLWNSLSFPCLTMAKHSHIG
jgi:hypothetical protein